MYLMVLMVLLEFTEPRNISQSSTYGIYCPHVGNIVLPNNNIINVHYIGWVWLIYIYMWYDDKSTDPTINLHTVKIDLLI